ncbi:hypothetical protein CRE_28814 [Caenorhabditis remanei]|uniref:Uncharacterized protein n=1 Tax=Caenorhabditis remanei TaxID=31234 RepID=E3MKA1_CAERE|nr:hypothetical protein CRE_28814 [Caenorhabditis remanei]
MSLPSTQFNPFGRHERTVASLKNEMNEVLEKIEENNVEWPAVAKQYTNIAEKLIEIVKDIPDYAIQSLLLEIAKPFSKFLSVLGAKSSEELRTYDFSKLIRKLSQFIQNIADNSVEPFNSDVLEQWSPMFEVFFSAKHNSFKENGALLWKKTFGRIKTPLRWPGNLRKTLEKLPKNLGIVLPPEARVSSNCSLLFLDEEAMDGLSASSGDSERNFKQPESKGEALESQNSFQFSQQPEANAMADKILKDHKMKAETAKSPKFTSKLNTPSSRRRTGKISLLDEDSCDFIPITSTPPSNRKVRLTDHQKETLSINRTDFIDEESQNPENLKQALRVNNYALDEDSISAPPVTKTMKSDPMDIDESSSHSISKSSARHLFDDTPFKSLPLASSSNPSFSSPDHTELERIPDLSKVSTESPPSKRAKTDIPSKDTDGDVVLETLPQIVRIDSTSRRGRPRKNENSEINSSGNKRLGRPRKDTQQQCLPVEKEVTKNSDASVISGKPAEEAMKSAIDPEDSFADAVPMDDLETTTVTKSPPKTPSILRASKRMASDSPMTERKRNRVHFNEDSLPQESTSSPITPRRRAGSSGKSPLRPQLTTTISIVESNVDSKSSTNSLLEMESTTAEPIVTTPFFPALVDCKDRIDRIIPNLVFMCRKTYMDSAKKSLQSIGVKTVGQFAALSKADIEKLTWIKGKTTGAKNVLTQHEKMWNSVVAEDVGEDVGDVVESVEPTDSAESATVENTSSEELKIDTNPPTVPESEITQSAERIQETTEMTPQEEVNPTPFESEKGDPTPVVSEAPESGSTPSEASQTPQEEVNPTPVESDELADDSTPLRSGSTPSEDPKTPQKTPEASQSPASPISSNTASIVSTISSTDTVEPRERSAVVSRKNLAPMFLGKAIKKETQSPQKTEVQKQIESAETSFQEDGRLLHRICVNISNAHSQNKWPVENSTKLLSNLNKAAIVFKNIVQIRGSGDWDDVEYENDHVDTFSVEDDIESLVKVYKRFSRHHTSSMASCLPWKSVMDCLNESACLLESIYLARTPSS